MNDNRQFDDDKARSPKSGVVDDNECEEGAVEEDMDAKRAAFLAWWNRCGVRSRGANIPLPPRDRGRGHRPHLGY